MSHGRDEGQSSASRWLDDEEYWNDEFDLRELDTLATHVQLQQLFEGESEREARIQRVISANQALPVTQSLPAKSRHITQLHTRRSRDSRWTIAVAAFLVFLCVFGILLPTKQNSALAAIEKAIEALQQPVTRKYEVILKIGPMGRELNVDLFSQGKTEFRVELIHFPIQPAVIGGDAETRWAIVGTKRWDSTDQDPFPLDDVLDRVSLRFMILHDVLSVIPSDYEYVKVRGLTPAGESLVTATLRNLQSRHGGSDDQLLDRIQLPDRIAVRIDDQTGVVKDLKFYWDHRQLGLRELSVKYVGEVDLDLSRN